MSKRDILFDQAVFLRKIGRFLESVIIDPGTIQLYQEQSHGMHSSSTATTQGYNFGTPSETEMVWPGKIYWGF